MTEETSDPEVASEEDVEESITELLEQLGKDLAALVYYESRLAAERNKAQIRQVAGGVAAALAALAALLTAFVLANTAALLGLATVMDAWLAALILAAAWTAVGVVVALMLRARVKRAEKGEGETLEEASERAEQAVRATLEKLGPTITKEIALAAVPTAGGIAEFGEDLIEGVDDIVDDLADEIPGGGRRQPGVGRRDDPWPLRHQGRHNGAQARRLAQRQRRISSRSSSRVRSGGGVSRSRAASTSRRSSSARCASSRRSCSSSPSNHQHILISAEWY